MRNPLVGVGIILFAVVSMSSAQESVTLPIERRMLFNEWMFLPAVRTITRTGRMRGLIPLVLCRHAACCCPERITIMRRDGG